MCVAEVRFAQRVARGWHANDRRHAADKVSAEGCYRLAIMDLPKPKLERDPDDRTKYRLLFEIRSATGLDADVFNGEAGGHTWPTELPRPHLDRSKIDVRRLEYEQIQPYIAALRERVDASNAELERGRPEREAQEQESREAWERREQEFAEAQRVIDDFFD